MSRGNIVLRGSKVALSSMTEADQTKFCVWLQSEKLRSLIDDPRVPGLDDQMKWFERSKQPDRTFFSIVTVPGGQLIGNCGFVDMNTSVREATLRITIGNPDYVGRGLGSEAVSLLTYYGFESMSLTRILLKVLESNVRAVRTYEKAGFTKESQETIEGKKILTMILTKPARS